MVTDLLSTRNHILKNGLVCLYPVTVAAAFAIVSITSNLCSPISSLPDPEPLKILSFLTHDETLSPDTDPSHTPPSQQISEENVLTHIVNTLRNGTEEEQLKAQELMITLAQGVSVDHLNCAFAHSDALPLLLEMLRGKHMLKIKALKIIRILSKEHNLRRVIVDSPNGLETLVGMVQTGIFYYLNVFLVFYYT